VTTDVPEVARDLYAEPPDDFVASRNALAKQLKADGDAATAAIVAKLRRPTVAASVVNLAARAHPDLVRELLDAGGRLAGAQRQLLSGKATAAKDLRTTGDERRRLVRGLTDAAITTAAEAGRAVDHLRDEVAGTFEAATLDDDLGGRLREGTVEKAVTPSAGLTGLEGFAVLPGGADQAADPEEEPQQGDDGPSRAQRAADQAADDAEQARNEADRAIESADAAAARAHELATAADDAERAAREAKAEERRLRDEAATAKRRAERAERSADAAARRAER
jgi:hypothetical protein